MLSQRHKYPISCARVHDAIGADALSLRASTGQPHQNEKRPAGEFGLFDLGSDPAAVGGTVRIAGIRPLGSLPPEPVGAFQAAGGAKIGGHRSASEGFTDNADQPLRLRFAAGQIAEQLQGRGDGRQQHQNIRSEG